MEQIFFLVLIAVVGLARWFLQAAENKKNTEAEKQSGAPAASTPPGRAPAQSEEERVRRFFEALGVPTSGSPPPRVQPRQITPRKPKAKPTIAPIDPFPMPRTGGLPPPLVAPAPSVIREAPPVPKSPAILPQRIPSTARVEPAAAKFEVHDIDEAWLADPSPGDLHVLTAGNWRASGDDRGTARCHRPARDLGTATQPAALQPQRPWLERPDRDLHFGAASCLEISDGNSVFALLGHRHFGPVLFRTMQRVAVPGELSTTDRHERNSPAGTHVRID